MRKTIVVLALFVLAGCGSARAQFCPGLSPWVFDDVAANHPFCSDVTAMALRGVTTGCSVIDAEHRLYCPDLFVTRVQMARFLGQFGRSLFPLDCAAGQVMKWDGSVWSCAPDNVAPGTVTSVLAGTGLQASPNPITGSGSINLAPGFQLPQGCGAGAVAKSNGANTWACAADVDTNSGGTVTSVSTGAGLTGGPITLSGTIAVAPGGIGNAQLANGAVDVAKLDTVSTDARYFRQGGNTFGAPAVLGTGDVMPLELRAGGMRVVRLEPGTVSPNVVAGSHENNVSSGVRGATIAGGGVTGDDPNFLDEAPNRVTDAYGFVGGGWGNRAGNDAGTAIDRPFAAVAGGKGNVAAGSYSAVLGGEGNTSSGNWSTIAGGGGNVVTTAGSYASVGGGDRNTASGGWATVGGGLNNTASNIRSTVGGGENNEASGVYSIVAGGLSNYARAQYATVAGGVSNFASNDTTSGFAATVGGGANNTANGQYATVPGGRMNVALADYTFAAGRQARVNSGHPGAFVWADSNDAMFASTAANQFSVRATGGVRLVLAVDNAGAPTWTCSVVDGGSWACSSDRNLKQLVRRLPGREVLDRVADLPIYEWYPRGASATVRHYGPTAQDFHARFALGDSELRIGQQDADGVALAAIQGLNELVREQHAEIAKLKSRLAAHDAAHARYRAELDELRRAVAVLLTHAPEHAPTRSEVATAR